MAHLTMYLALGTERWADGPPATLTDVLVVDLAPVIAALFTAHQ